MTSLGPQTGKQPTIGSFPRKSGPARVVSSHRPRPRPGLQGGVWGRWFDGPPPSPRVRRADARAERASRSSNLPPSGNVHRLSGLLLRRLRGRLSSTVHLHLGRWDPPVSPIELEALEVTSDQPATHRGGRAADELADLLTRQITGGRGKGRGVRKHRPQIRPRKGHSRGVGREGCETIASMRSESFMVWSVAL